MGDWFTPDELSRILQSFRGHWWAPLLLVSFYAIFCPLGVPASPFILAGGAIFGFFVGLIWNWIGTMLGAVLSYGLARFLGREAVERLGGARLRQAEALLRRRGAPMLIGMRFLPIPFAFANSAAALVGVPFNRFLWTTALGILPPLGAMSYAASLILDPGADRRAILQNLSLAFLALGFLVILPAVIRRRLRKRRLRRLLVTRQQRPRPRAS
jgi:uncharacterized membrane protein YdjX (TVP38/TMEM64 family)